MTYRLRILENFDESEKFDEFVANHPDGNYFQSLAYLKLMSRMNNIPIAILVEDDNNQICGILSGTLLKEGKGIKGKISTRIIITGGPLISNNDHSVADLLLNELISKYAATSTYFEFRNLFSLTSYLDIFNKYGFKFKPHLNYLVLLDEEKAVKKRMSESKVRQIKSSLKAGVTISEVKDIYEVNDLYAILKKLYIEKVKKPLPGVELFQYFFQMNHGKIFIIQKDDKIIGGIICPIFKNKTIYEWYICGLDGMEKGIYPSVMATWAPIEFGLKNGIKYFDFLGAGSPDADYGVREFKEKFGGELVENGRFIRINKPLVYQLGKWGLKLYSIFR